MKRILCSACCEDADTIHIVPWVVVLGNEQRVEFACPNHDPGGYWFPIEHWTKGPADWDPTRCADPEGLYTAREHIRRTKIDGVRTADLVDFALVQGHAARRDIEQKPPTDDPIVVMNAADFLATEYLDEVPHRFQPEVEVS